MPAATLDKPPDAIHTSRTLDKPLKTPAVPDGDFLVFEDRPIFCEHTATDGTVYDKRRLQELCDNQNRRISETGDFTPIVVGHTPDKYELARGAGQPEVIGFAGPFRLGLIGNDSPKWAILARLHVFTGDETKFRKNPRCSVELWPDEGFFDPISVLGAETPKLELGMHYARDRQGRDVRRYTAVAPSGTNVFAPTTADDKNTARAGADKHKQSYSAESQVMALSPEDIGQIVEALKSTAEFQWIQAKMQSEAGNGDGLGDGSDVDAAPPAEPPAAPPAKPAVPPAAKGEEPDEKYAAECDPADEPPTGGVKEQYRKPVADAGGEKDKYSKEKPMPDSQVAAGGVQDRQARAIADAERDELKVKYAKAQKDARDFKDKYERLTADVESLKYDKRRADRKSALLDLTNAGYQLDLEEELGDCDGMDDKGFEKHLERIRTKYARAPIGRSLPQEPAKKFIKSEQDSIDLSNKARTHALKHGLSYSAALEAVQRT